MYFICKQPIIIFFLIGGLIFTSCNVQDKDDLLEDVVSSSEITNTTSSSIIEPDKKPLTEVMDFWLPLEYDYVSEFSNGYGLLIKDGANILVNDKLELIYSTAEYEVVSLYKNVICIKSYDNTKYGLIDNDGNIIVQPQFDAPIVYNDDLAIVEHEGKVGYISLQGELAVDYFYEWGCPFNEGLAAVGIDEQFWFIDKKGGVKSGPYNFLNSEAFVYNIAYMQYSDGYTAFFEITNKGANTNYSGKGYWGYLDGEGKIVIEAQYKSVRPFCNGIAAVETEEGNWIYINKSGEKIMEGFPADFINGWACNGREFIDISGNVMLKLPDHYTVEANQQNGIDNFKYDSLVAVYNEEQSSYGVMDKKGMIVLESEEFQEIKVFNKDHVAVKINDKWGVIYLKQE